MKRMKCCVGLLLAALLLLSGCAKPASAAAEDGALTVVAATHPLWCFAANLLEGVEGVNLELMVDQQISCIHDYTLSVRDMLLLEDADLMLLNGAGFDAFVSDALAGYPDLPCVDCAAGVTLRAASHGADSEAAEHDHDGEIVDGHIWLDPRNAAIMTQNIADELCQLLPDAAETITANCAAYTATLTALYEELNLSLSELGCRELITFHDGFGYFADAFGLTILKSIEEEAGSEASAAEITDIISLIETHKLPAIFVERNGANATARAIAAETGVTVGTLDTAISGDRTLTAYADAMRANVAAILDYLGSRGR